MILIVPDKFKGTYTAAKVADGVEFVVKQIVENEEIVKLPLADGGDGFLSVVKNVFPAGKKCMLTTFDPLMRRIKAPVVFYDNMAFIEMASCCGLSLLAEEERNPEKTTTFGLGVILLKAVKKGVKKIYIGIGGSATNDGGAGMLSALDGKLHLFENVEIIVACDVDNPLLGRNGATYVYAPQKGADKKMVKQLEKRMRVHAALCKEKLSEMGLAEKAANFTTIPGAGAAGGIGAALYGFLNATLVKGWKLIGELVGLEEKVKAARIVIAGEGSIDKQSFNGKLLSGVEELCIKHRRKLFGVCGILKCSLKNRWIKDAVQLNNFGSKESVSKAFAKPHITKQFKDWLRQEQECLCIGCDEAGRGPLAGPVYAAAAILPENYYHPLLRDSKTLSAAQRDYMRKIIEKEAVSWCVASCSEKEIDEMNILRASITAMHRALDGLFSQNNRLDSNRKEDYTILVDGNRFFKYKEFKHKCIVKGDAKVPAISAASILAKTHRDEYMKIIAKEYPEYGWEHNMGYCTAAHVKAIYRSGFTKHHRKSFTVPAYEPELPLLF